jgi:16S rRNA (cytosine967-C5)-methyltransferase
LLVATTLRRLGQIDAVLGKCLDRPLSETKPRLRNILRLGAAQLIFLQTSAHAAVDATVRLAGREASSRGLINAVLRRLIRQAEPLAPGDDSAHLNTPDWMFESWRATFGLEAARAIAAAHLREPPLDLTLKEPGESKKWGAALAAEILAPGALRRTAGGRIEDLAGYAEGAWWVQDVAATLPVGLLASALGGLAGKRVIDLCAAPGGKTLQLCAGQAEVTAVDRSKKRLRLIEANLRRTGLSARLIDADAGVWRPHQAVDGVLLDAPCTATGTLRRHPDAAYLKSPADVARMADLQSRLIEAAIGMLKPGGVLVYCTCSLQAAECEDQALRLRADARLEHLPIEGPEMAVFSEAIDAQDDLRTLPSHLAGQGGMDGFFATRLRRRRD